MLFPTIEFGLFLSLTFALAWIFKNHNSIRKIILLGFESAILCFLEPKVRTFIACRRVHFLSGGDSSGQLSTARDT
jgi:hypothetical protein